MSQAHPLQPTESSSRGESICLFGGTFDPIHTAHLEIARAAADKFSLERVFFVPARHPPHKDAAGITPYKHRWRMVELACAPYPEFVASRLEQEDRPSYTVDTLERLKSEAGADTRLFFLIGSDAFDELETWKRWQDVVRLTDFIVVRRPGHDYHIPENARVHTLEGLALPVSSSSIRNRLAAAEATPELPEPVRHYIEVHGLYGFGQNLTAAP